jgi:hypothetical protein
MWDQGADREGYIEIEPYRNLLCAFELEMGP